MGPGARDWRTGIQSLARETESLGGAPPFWGIKRGWGECLNRGGGADEGKDECAPAHHIFFALIERNLTEREAAREEVKASSNEAVVADLLVRVVHVLGTIPRGWIRQRSVRNITIGQHSLSTYYVPGCVPRALMCSMLFELLTQCGEFCYSIHFAEVEGGTDKSCKIHKESAPEVATVGRLPKSDSHDQSQLC